MNSRYVGNDSLCFDLKKVTTMCEENGTLRVIFDNGVCSTYNTSEDQTFQIIKIFKEYLLSLG